MAAPGAGPGVSMPSAGTKVRGRAGEEEERLPLDRDFPDRPTGWPFKDPYDFMRGKRADDGVPAHLWRVHDHYYDLAGFKHPGGAQWLSLTRGTDVTELFETHHLDYDRIKRMLDLYRVEDATPAAPRRSPFTFEPDGFYSTLRKKVWAAHGGKARKSGASEVAALGAPRLTKMFADAAAVLSVVLTAAAGRASSFRAAAGYAVGTGVLNGLFIGIGHNFMHQKDNFRRHYQDISGFSSSEFRMHHALSHHPFTNTRQDAEINQLLPEVSLFPGLKTSSEKLRARVVLALACALAVPAGALTRFTKILLGRWNGNAADRLAQIIPLTQLALLSKFGSAPKSGFGLYLMMLSTTSNMFLWANFLTGPHFNDECWHQGDTLDSRDWGLLQVQTNTERSNMSHADSASANLLNIPTFGLHHLHHLFPTIDATQLSKIVPLFEEHCEEFGVTFSLMDAHELRQGLSNALDGYAPNDRTRNGIYKAKL